MLYDVIVIGAGASGLFFSANCKGKKKKLLLEGSSRIGTKLLISGSGQCNITHGGDIKEFIDKYGDNGRKIRSILYKYSNKKVREFFENKGVSTFEREDGKVFPKSLRATSIVDLLYDETIKNGFEVKKNCKVNDIKREVYDNQIIYEIIGNNFKFRCKNLVIATGGCSYTKTGSDGSMFESIRKNFEDIKIKELKEGLVPIYVENYRFDGLSGIALKGCKIEKMVKGEDSVNSSGKKNKLPTYYGDLLFTHKTLSGPLIIDFSRYLKNGDKFKISFTNEKINLWEDINRDKSSKNIINYIAEKYDIPKALVQKIVEISIEEKLQNQKAKEKLQKRKEYEIEYNKLLKEKATSINKKFVNKVNELLIGFEFTVSGNQGFEKAMVTVGGIDIGEISPKSMESKKHQGLYFIGEVLDVDGNTGGYNIQFAFSSSYIAAQHISQLP